jgi:hypothetical protein
MLLRWSVIPPGYRLVLPDGHLLHDIVPGLMACHVI